MVQIPHFLTADQARAKTVLDDRIDRALGLGLVVPCIGDYDRFDHQTCDPAAACAGCPVLGSCRRYADTGAVRHGIIAGRLASTTPVDRAA